jgi:small-conductance mechanosensitive channel
MSQILDLFALAEPMVKVLITVILCFIFLAVLNRYLKRYWQKRKFQFQFLMLCLTLVSIVAVIITLPLSDALRGQLLALFGILLSASIAFASATFIGNMLAGFMLRAIQNIKLGDFITVDNITGRATELNLLHVEIQTEQSDLVTIPNIHMVTFPVKVVRSSGTIVSIEVSLGYDISRQLISEQLSLASEDAGLKDGFVQIRNLGDFSVTYRIAGQLSDISNLLSVKANLYSAVLDRLHAANIEIVSPNFMNTRAIGDKPFIPASSKSKAEDKDNKLEKLAFEKAEMATAITKVQTEISELTSRLDDEKSALSAPEREAIKDKLKALEEQLTNEEDKFQQKELKEQ